MSPSRATRPGAGLAVAWSPLVQIAIGVNGTWLDPSDATTLWQDSDGTTPAGVGDPVGRITDRSGNGNHATQATTSSKPTLRESGGLRYLEFDGVDDFLEVPSCQAGPTILTGIAYKSRGLNYLKAIAGGYYTPALRWQRLRHAWNGSNHTISVAHDVNTPVINVADTIHHVSFYGDRFATNMRHNGQTYLIDPPADAGAGFAFHTQGKIGCKFNGTEEFAAIDLYGCVAVDNPEQAPDQVALETFFETKTGGWM